MLNFPISLYLENVSVKAIIQFEVGSNTLCDFANGNRQITKKSTGYNEFVFANFRFSDPGSSEFSVRLLKLSSPISQISIGAAIDSTRSGSGLHAVGWCTMTQTSYLYALGPIYYSQHAPIREGQVVTVRVDVARKQIVYVVDGVPAGPPHTMNISDADLLRLRPAVQIYYMGDSLEIA